MRTRRSLSVETEKLTSGPKLPGWAQRRAARACRVRAFSPLPRETGPISGLRGQSSHRISVPNRCVTDVTQRETAQNRL
jgi:hypothetical protein